MNSKQSIVLLSSSSPVRFVFYALVAFLTFTVVLGGIETDHQIKLKKEQEDKEKMRRYEAQAHLYTTIKNAEKNKEDILLFFKLYDPEKEELRYIGRLFVMSSGKPTEIILKLNERAGFSPDEDIELYEVSDILYYEVLDIPLPELQCLKTLKVSFHHVNKEEPVIHNIRLPKQSTVGDVLSEIKSKVTLSHPNAELRLLEVFYYKIHKIFPLTEKIENINDQYWTLCAEEILEEEKNIGPQDRLIHVYHFTKVAAQNQMQVLNFGKPFFLVIHDNETLADVKVRIQRKLRVLDEEFSKWKFAFMSLGRPDYLQDSDVVSNRFQRRDVYGSWEQYLGLEH